MKRIYAMLALFLAAGLSLVLLSACASPAPQPSPEPEQNYTDEETPVSSPVEAADPVENFAGAADLLDPPHTERATVAEPDITVSVQWEEGAEDDSAIRELAAEYFTLMGTIISAPEATYENVTCCSDEVLQELLLYGWLASNALYPQIGMQVTLSPAVKYPDGTTRVTAELQMDVKFCWDISRTSFDSDANQETCKPVPRETHQLTLSRDGEGWTVAWDEFVSSFGSTASGYATNHTDDTFCLAPIQSYFSMRANVLSGGNASAEHGCCISALCKDAADFAQDLLKDCPEILKIYRVESRVRNVGQFRRIDGDAATQVPVDECIRVEYLSANWSLECSIFHVTHTITTFPQADSELDVVVGDLYKRFGHACNIVEYPEPLWAM